MAQLNTALKVYAGPTLGLKVYAGAQPILPKLAAKYIFPGVLGNRLSTPGIAAFNITGDLEMVAYVDPTAGGGWQTVAMDVVGKYLTTGNQRAYRLNVAASGALTLTLSGDGVATATSTSTIGVAAAAGAQWIKTTRQAGVVKHYTAAAAPTEPTTWTQLGTDRTTTVTGTIATTTASVTVGDLAASGQPYKGRIYRAIIRNGIGGTTVFDLNENDANANISTSLVCASGQTVTSIVTAGNTIIQPRVP